MPNVPTDHDLPGLYSPPGTGVPSGLAGGPPDAPPPCRLPGREGEDPAFRALFERQWRPLHRLACRELDPDEAKDVVQLVFIKTYKRYEIGDPSMPPITDASRIDPYLTACVRVGAAAYRRAKRSEESRVARWWSELTDSAPEWVNPLHWFEARTLRQFLRELLDLLPEKRRMAFTLKRVDGLETEEVAAFMGISKNTVRVHLFHANEIIAKALVLAGYRDARATEEKQS